MLLLAVSVRLQSLGEIMGRRIHRLVVGFTVVATLAVPGMVIPAVAGVGDRPATPTGPFSFLIGVSGISATSAWTVGGYFNGTQDKTLTKHWTGSLWDEKAGANPGGTDGSYLSGVSELADDNVWAVGHYNSGSGSATLIERWNGRRWNVVASPNTGTDNRLVSVSAVAASAAWAVGSSTTASKSKTLVAHWDGSTWSTVASPSPRKGAVLTSVSADSDSDAWTVGYSGSTTPAALAERWDGSRWKIVPAPTPGMSSTLNSVAALSPTDAWAVGNSRATTGKALIEHWDGAVWSVVSSPKSPKNADLTGVSEAGPTDIWAVGTQVVAGVVTSLTEHWDGSSWTVVPSPNPSDAVLTQLTGITAVAVDVAWAVGYYDTGSRLRPLILRWDGTSWTQV